MSDVVLTAASSQQWLAPPARAYLIHGADNDLVRQTIEAIKAHAVAAEASDFDWEELDASACSVEDVLASAQRVPILSDRRVVVVHAAEAYARADRRAEAARLAEAMAGLPASSCVVLVVQASDTSKRKASVLTAQLDAAVRAIGHVVRCDPLEGPHLVAWAEAYARRHGKTLARSAAQRLVESVSERHAVEAELDKLAAYVGDRSSIDVKDVEELVGRAPEDVIFRLVDAVSARKTAEALVLLRRAAQFEARSQTLAGKLIALLNRQLRLLWQSRALIEMGIPAERVRNLPEDVQSELPQEASLASVAWKAGAIAGDARKWTMEELTQALARLVECDASNKGEEAGSRDALANLELLIVALGRRSSMPASAGPH